jgi:hypothetical protein
VDVGASGMMHREGAAENLSEMRQLTHVFGRIFQYAYERKE